MFLSLNKKVAALAFFPGDVFSVVTQRTKDQEERSLGGDFVA